MADPYIHYKVSDQFFSFRKFEKQEYSFHGRGVPCDTNCSEFADITTEVNPKNHQIHWV